MCESQSWSHEKVKKIVQSADIIPALEIWPPLTYFDKKSKTTLILEDFKSLFHHGGISETPFYP